MIDDGHIRHLDEIIDCWLQKMKIKMTHFDRGQNSVVFNVHSSDPIQLVSLEVRGFSHADTAMHRKVAKWSLNYVHVQLYNTYRYTDFEYLV